jgi:hypothetical protein
MWSSRWNESWQGKRRIRHTKRLVNVISALKLASEGSYEAMIITYQTSRSHNPEALNLNVHRYENLMLQHAVSLHVCCVTV